MKRKPPGISPEDSELFRDAIGEVRRIEAEPVVPARPGPPPEPKRLRIDEEEALRESRMAPADLALDAADLLSYRRPELPERVFKQLKRGEYSIQDEIDLHHLRAADAEALLKQFLNSARRGHHPCVRIVHGKGLRSEGAPVLKSLVDRVLRHRGDVLAFASAPINQGGSGAVLVLLDER
ncbi:MAG TPA: Smr/MutS family protein [Arenimonas sp.]|uniref:Smr/MutS family protein n=1 Tax=Arenimonas sp. TaxID=1872635 RepID=UPI002B8B2E34|nr:Smr/MutS family protein [Arenimonas sp.]HMB57645.1 Smr/MutS family protein [Arenimonas sp.]